MGKHLLVCKGCARPPPLHSDPTAPPDRGAWMDRQARSSKVDLDRNKGPPRSHLNLHPGGPGTHFSEKSPCLSPGLRSCWSWPPEDLHRDRAIGRRLPGQGQRQEEAQNVCQCWEQDGRLFLEAA